MFVKSVYIIFTRFWTLQNLYRNTLGQGALGGVTAIAHRVVAVAKLFGSFLQPVQASLRPQENRLPAHRGGGHAAFIELVHGELLRLPACSEHAGLPALLPDLGFPRALYG